MTELKAYYEGKCSSEAIDISKKVIQTIESNQSSYNIKQLNVVAGFARNTVKKRFILVSLVALIMLAGFTYVSRLQFVDGDNKLWEIWFNSDEPSSANLFLRIMQELDLEHGDGNWMILYSNNGESDAQFMLHVYPPETSEQITLLNEKLNSILDSEMSGQLLDQTFAYGEFSYQFDDENMHDMLIDHTPLGEYSYILIKDDNPPQFVCSDKSVAYDLSELNINEKLDSITYYYGEEFSNLNSDMSHQHIEVKFYPVVSNIVLNEKEEYNQSSYKMTVNGYEFWVEMQEANGDSLQDIEMIYLQDDIVVEMRVYSNEITDAEAVNSFADIIEKVYK